MIPHRRLTPANLPTRKITPTVAQQKIIFNVMGNALEQPFKVIWTGIIFYSAQ